MNQVRIRDVVEDEPKMFEVHKIEPLKADMVLGVTKSSVILRLECDSAYTKDDWVKAINTEVKQLRYMAKILSSPFQL